MTNNVLRFFCPKCNSPNHPFGEMKIQLPHKAKVTCDSCHHLATMVWLDDDQKRASYAKEHGLTQSQDNSDKIQILQNKIDSLEARADADRKEIQNLRQLIDLAIKKDIKELRENASQHEYDTNFLQEEITKLQKTFDEIRDWQKKQDG